MARSSSVRWSRRGTDRVIADLRTSGSLGGRVMELDAHALAG